MYITLEATTGPKVSHGTSARGSSGGSTHGLSKSVDEARQHGAASDVAAEDYNSTSRYLVADTRKHDVHRLHLCDYSFLRGEMLARQKVFHSL